MIKLLPITGRKVFSHIDSKFGVALIVFLFFSFFFLFDCCFSLVMSCNWFPHGSSEHNADCTVPQIWARLSCLMWPHSWRLEDVFCELRPNRDAAGTGSSAGGMRGGGLEWDLSGQITKSGPRVFWQAAECEIYRISYVGRAAASVPI